VEDGRDHSRACENCEWEGRSAEDCGPKTLKSNHEQSAQLAQHKVPPQKPVELPNVDLIPTLQR